MNDVWYYSTGEAVPAGPVSLEELKGLASSGFINSETYVIPEGAEEWITYGSILRQFVPPIPPQLPPVPQYASEKKLGKAARFLGGGCLGAFTGSVPFTIGILLCMTVVLAPIGIVLILIGMFMPVASIVTAPRTIISGHCPYCGHGPTSRPAPRTGRTGGFFCWACFKRVLIRNNQFTRVD